MGHLGDGALRRLIDEPLAMSDSERFHYQHCERCQARRREYEVETESAGRLLAVGPAEVDTQAALRAVTARSGQPAPAPLRLFARSASSLNAFRRPILLAAALLALASVAVTAGPALLTTTIFEPKGPVTTVTVNPPTGDTEGLVAGLPDLSAYGDMTVIKKAQTQTGVTAAEAASTTGLKVLTPPAQYATGSVTYTTVTASEGSFTFSKTKAIAAAQAAGKPVPVFPDGIDGSTIDVTAGPALVEVFGTVDKNSTLSNLPLIVASSKAPVVKSTGVSYEQLEAFLVAQPGIAGNATLVAAIHAIGAPLAAGQLAIPIPADRATSKDETTSGVPGVLISDKTGLASALVWQKGDIVYAAGGHFDESQLLAIYQSIG